MVDLKCILTDNWIRNTYFNAIFYGF